MMFRFFWLLIAVTLINQLDFVLSESIEIVRNPYKGINIIEFVQPTGGIAKYILEHPTSIRSYRNISFSFSNPDLETIEAQIFYEMLNPIRNETNINQDQLYETLLAHLYTETIGKVIK